MSAEPVEVARCGTRYEAELLTGLLEDAGIDAVLTTSLSGYGERALLGDHRILVRAEDAERASEIVAGWLGDEGSDEG